MKDKRVAKSIKFNPDNKMDKVILDYLEDKNFSEIVKTHIYELATGSCQYKEETVNELTERLLNIESLVKGYSEKLDRLNRLDRLDMLDVLVKLGTLENEPVRKKERKVKEEITIPKRKIEYHEDDYADEELDISEITVSSNFEDKEEELEEETEENDIAFGLLNMDDEE